MASVDVLSMPTRQGSAVSIEICDDVSSSSLVNDTGLPKPASLHVCCSTVTHLQQVVALMLGRKEGLSAVKTAKALRDRQPLLWALVCPSWPSMDPESQLSPPRQGVNSQRGTGGSGPPGNFSLVMQLAAWLDRHKAGHGSAVVEGAVLLTGSAVDNESPGSDVLLVLYDTQVERPRQLAAHTAQVLRRVLSGASGLSSSRVRWGGLIGDGRAVVMEGPNVAAGAGDVGSKRKRKETQDVTGVEPVAAAVCEGLALLSKEKDVEAGSISIVLAHPVNPPAPPSPSKQTVAFQQTNGTATSVALTEGTAEALPSAAAMTFESAVLPNASSGDLPWPAVAAAAIERSEANIIPPHVSTEDMPAPVPPVDPSRTLLDTPSGVSEAKSAQRSPECLSPLPPPQPPSGGVAKKSPTPSPSMPKKAPSPVVVAPLVPQVIKKAPALTPLDARGLGLGKAPPQPLIIVLLTADTASRAPSKLVDAIRTASITKCSGDVARMLVGVEGLGGNGGTTAIPFMRRVGSNKPHTNNILAPPLFVVGSEDPGVAGLGSALSWAVRDHRAPMEQCIAVLESDELRPAAVAAGVPESSIFGPFDAKTLEGFPDDMRDVKRSLTHERKPRFVAWDHRLGRDALVRNPAVALESTGMVTHAIAGWPTQAASRRTAAGDASITADFDGRLRHTEGQKRRIWGAMKHHYGGHAVLAARNTSKKGHVETFGALMRPGGSRFVLSGNVKGRYMCETTIAPFGEPALPEGAAAGQETPAELAGVQVVLSCKCGCQRGPLQESYEGPPVMPPTPTTAASVPLGSPCSTGSAPFANRPVAPCCIHGIALVYEFFKHFMERAEEAPTEQQ